MKGIQINGGAAFVEHNGITVRIKNGKCELSPISFCTLEWDLRTEPPQKWDYLTVSDIKGLGSTVYDDILRMTDEVKSI